MSDDTTRTETEQPTPKATKAGAKMRLPRGIFPPVIAQSVEAFGFKADTRDPRKAARLRKAAKKSREAYAAQQAKLKRKR